MKSNNAAPTSGVSYAPAMNGRGFRFTGRDDAVLVPDSRSLTLTHSFTINAWINVDAFPTPEERMGMIVFRGDDRAGLDPYGFGVMNDQRLLLHLDSEKASVEIAAPVPGHRFLMVTAILDDTTGKLEIYENTTLVAHTVTTVRPLAALDPAQHAAIGIGNCNAVPGGGFRYPFHGVISDLRIWRRVLAPGELRSLYEDYLWVPDPLASERNEAK